MTDDRESDSHGQLVGREGEHLYNRLQQTVQHLATAVHVCTRVCLCVSLVHASTDLCVCVKECYSREAEKQRGGADQEGRGCGDRDVATGAERAGRRGDGA